MKKRILYIGNNLSNSSFTTTYISFLSEGLRNEGYLVQTASAKNNKILRLADMLFLILKNRKKTDCVLIDTYGSWNFYYAYASGRLCQLLNLPYIPILHGGDLPHRLSSSRILCRNLFGKAKLNIAPSPFFYKLFLFDGFANTLIIPNSIVLGNYPFTERSHLGPKLLWVRRFQKRYNPMLTLRTYRKLRELYPTAELCMVGPDKDGSMEICKAYAEKHALPVLFPGKLEKKEWIALSVNHDIFINSTDIDNTPISVIEAMALGLAVISTDVGGMPSLINHNEDGYLVSPNQADKLLAAIQDLLQEQGKGRKLAVSARKKVEAFAWETVKEEWHKVLNE